jgi:hypothetical protein
VSLTINPFWKREIIQNQLYHLEVKQTEKMGGILREVKGYKSSLKIENKRKNIL